MSTLTISGFLNLSIIPKFTYHDLFTALRINWVIEWCAWIPVKKTARAATYICEAISNLNKKG